MLSRRIEEFTEKLLHPGEQIALSVVGFRPIPPFSAVLLFRGPPGSRPGSAAASAEGSVRG